VDVGVENRQILRESWIGKDGGKPDQHYDKPSMRHTRAYIIPAAPPSTADSLGTAEMTGA
jgi:hypothetical protein